MRELDKSAEQRRVGWRGECIAAPGMRAAVVIALLGVAMTGTGFAQPVVTAPNAQVEPEQRPQGVSGPQGVKESQGVSTSQGVPAPPGVPSVPRVAALPGVEPPIWELSESTALWLSLGGTAASWGLIVASTQFKGSGTGVATVAVLGAVGAPSLGHLYADSFGVRGLGLRLVGAGAAVLGVLWRTVEVDDRDRVRASTRWLLYGGTALLIVGTIDDLVTVPSAVRRYNLRLHGMAIAPMIGRGRGGVALAARF